MLDVIRWVLAVELMSFACLPLAMWVCRSLPDRGYIFAKPLALLLVTYVTWIIGSFLPLARSPLLPGAVVVLLAAGGWAVWRAEVVESLRAARRPILMEEALFLGGVVILSLLRVNTFGSGISHTEQFMDMAIMNASFHSASYPPYDPWMSGHTINYYYFGYLIFGTLAKLSGVSLAVAYNLALSTIFGLLLACGYAIVYAFTRHLLWPLLAPLFLGAIGNWHYLLWTMPHGATCPNTSTFWGPIWESSRVIGSGFTLANWASGPPWAQAGACNLPSNTIDEYPLFSFILGDMHPHVMSLPFTLLAVGLGIAVLRGGIPLALSWTGAGAGRLVMLAISVGSLFTINSWDFPTYLLVVAACIVANAYTLDDSAAWWRRPVEAVLVLAVLSVVLFAPFYLHFKSIASGIGRVTTPSDIYEFFQVFGFFLLLAALLTFALSVLLQPSSEEAIEETGDKADVPEPSLAAEAGETRLDFTGSSGRSGLLAVVGVGIVAIIAAALHLGVLVLLAILSVAALVMLRRVVNTDEPNHGDAAALILVAAGCAVIALPEIAYIRDSFDGSTMYRMNTVFKFYYQGWTLLALAGAYGAYRSWQIVKSLYRSLIGWIVLAAIAAGALGAGTYTALAFSAQPGDTSSRSLDGEAWVATSNPGDLGALQWLQTHAVERSVVVEGVGDDYSFAARASTFSGLPTVMGWIGHEQQWRGADPEIEQRVHDVGTIYTTRSVTAAERLLRQYDVRYVIVGSQERLKYGKSRAGLSKFGRFMRAVYHNGTTTLYSW